MVRCFFLKILLSFNFALLSSCAIVPAQLEPPLQVVNRVNINKYLGRWYEIARYPNWFQENCYGVSADYEMNDDGYIRVTNKCKDRELNGETREALGMAHAVEGSRNAKLKVVFHWPFYGNYWIIDIGDGYEYAVISEPKRQYLWILSREPTMEASKYNQIVKSLENQNFDLSWLKVTPNS